MRLLNANANEHPLRIKLSAVHSVLVGKIDLIVANSYKIKHTPGRKSDVNDSEWIAELCLNGMIEPSRIFPKDDRELFI